MTALLSLLVSPAARLLGIALLAVSLVTGAYVKGRVDEHKFVTVKIEKEAADAVAKANAARAAAEKKFDSGRDNNRPSIVPGWVRHGSDGFARD